MWQLLVTVLTSSLLGSLHCVAMCGPLLSVVQRPGLPDSVRLAGYHSLGRLATYTLFGALAGMAGKVVNLAGEMGNFQRIAAIMSGVTLVVWGVLAIRPRALAATAGTGRFAARLVQLKGRRPASRATLLGLLTGLLPCGWLWAFVAMAAGTGSPALGALVLAAFWLGTLPAMIGVVSVGGRIFTALRERRPYLTALVMIGLGLFTLWNRWENAGARGVTKPSCHSTAP